MTELQTGMLVILVLAAFGGFIYWKFSKKSGKPGGFGNQGKPSKK